jgi:6-phosphogluconolactonase
MQPVQTCRWHEFDSRASFEQIVVDFILEAARQAIAARGLFRIVLAGGNTPRSIYHKLCDADTDWSAWHVYFGDERCLPVSDSERNSHMARTVWLDRVAIPSRQVHVIPAELGPEAAAASYAAGLEDVGEFDLVLLGLGEDGHTASLFPGGAWERAAALPVVIPVFDSPKPPAQRVSLSPARLSHAAHVMYLVSGESKHDAVSNWRAGAPLPASRICPVHGVDVFLNTADDI